MGLASSLELRFIIFVEIVGAPLGNSWVVHFQPLSHVGLVISSCKYFLLCVCVWEVCFMGVAATDTRCFLER